MRGRIVVWVVAMAVLALAAAARASQEGMLDKAELNEYAAQNKSVRRFIKYNGYPDMAEVRAIKDQPPWDDHEVVLYYFGMHKEISFARARVLGRPEVTSTRYERTLTDGDVRALEAHGTKLNETKVASAATSVSCTGNAAERAECAAGRAENAADRVEVAAVQAEKAADRTEAIVEKMAAPSRVRRHKN